MLCKTCFSMLKDPYPGFHHDSNVSLRKAAWSGCRICKPLLQYCQRVSGSVNDNVSSPWRYTTQGKMFIESVTIIVNTFQGTQPVMSEHSFKVIQASDGEEIIDIHERNTKKKFKGGSRAANIWIQKCLAHHTKCRDNTQPPSYPTRLLRLSKSAVRLVIPSQGMISGPYAALSYCWGDIKAAWALTTSNLASRCKNDIRIDDLPIAFQESISFAQSLSIHYLWIDSLCIIQSGDGGKDWHAECGKIQKVYENCILDISIAHGESPSQSYFDQNIKELIYPFSATIPISKSLPSFKESIWNRMFKKITIIEENFVGRHLLELPINDRAWVLQEQFLSPRVLSFGHGQLFWNCMELENAFESCPHSLRHLRSRERFRSLPGKDFHEQQFFWKSMTERYTNRQLTFVEKDKLVAFSAIAERMATMTDSIYIAGHFWNQLPQSLPWQVVKSPGKSPQRKNTHTLEDGRQITTPSWSWASMDGRIEMPIMSTATRSVKSIADMVGVNLDLVNKEIPYGQVVSANLVLRAHCAEIQWTSGSPMISDQSILLNGSTSWNGQKISSWWIIDDPKDELHDGDKCAIVALSRITSTENLYGLVVKEVQNSTASVYTRIGYYCIRGPITLERMETWHGEKIGLTLV